ncbi:MAG: type II toxin-antitoxin system VapC family toxin [Gammaproteobacteria bacterium]|nr:type II toxin-antitoxin system VapC family toxin [Gammaproteobacteria bacterium]
MRFWDTSAVVPLLVEEARTIETATLFEEDRDFALWWSTPVECASAFTRLLREKRLDERGLDFAFERLDALVECGVMIEPCDTIRAEARRLVRVHPLRAADALQLAAAIELRGSPTLRQQFITYDERLALAARREGFAVNAP